jgi:hypothetical protein
MASQGPARFRTKFDTCCASLSDPLVSCRVELERFQRSRPSRPFGLRSGPFPLPFATIVADVLGFTLRSSASTRNHS